MTWLCLKKLKSRCGIYKCQIIIFNNILMTISTSSALRLSRKKFLLVG